ncbi:hypothetical protein CC2G_002024 [Coprinopsis cinerea AmutBmut pab1-1]|nr:hypothetical protein CC2G_002024 [Coprinopsis cinerea AmutBmut pab1-1]
MTSHQGGPTQQVGPREAGNIPTVPRTPRRTPMACTFCRGRKLKCDGGRPSCSNCNKRDLACNYVPVSSTRS